MKSGVALISVFLFFACGESVRPDRRPEPAPHPVHVFLITIDTLRADRLPAWGYADGRTPAIDRLIAAGAMFEDAVAHTPVTLPSHASILTGLHPPEHGVRANGTFRLPDGVPTLPGMLRDRGWRTAAFVSSFVLDTRFGLSSGFDAYDDETEVEAHQLRTQMWERRAERTVTRAIEWLDRQDGRHPLCLWLHLYDPHAPFEPPEPFAGRFADPYDGEIAYADSQLDRFFRYLTQRGLDRHAITVLTADHGESLGEHGERNHAMFIYEATQHVPLITRFPGGRHAGKRVTGLVRHVDIVPTVLRELGLKGPGLPGCALQPAVEAGTSDIVVAYLEAYQPFEEFGWSPSFALRTQNWKFIQSPIPELYDLPQDPAERNNLYAARGAVVRRLQHRLEKWQQRMTPVAGSRPVQLDPAEREALEALGYLQGKKQVEEALADPKEMMPLFELWGEARRRATGGDIDGADALLQQLLEMDPGNIAALIERSGLFAQRQQWAQAEQLCRDIIRRAPHRAEPHVQLARIHTRGMINFAEAEKDIKRAASASPPAPQVLELRVDLLHARGRIKDALRICNEVGLTSRESSLYSRCAELLLATGRPVDGEPMARRAAALDPRNGGAFLQLGRILERTGRREEALGYFRRAAALEPDNPRVVEKLVRRLIEDNHLAEARSALETASRVHPDDTSLRKLTETLNETMSRSTH